MCVQLEDDDCRDRIEVCLEAGVIAAEIANRISRYHGFALIADYGHSGDKTDTFRVTCHTLCCSSKKSDIDCRK